MLLPLCDVNDTLSLLFQRRSSSVSHARQVAFPGGSVDAEDLSREATALREAEEEIGLRPEAVRLLGRLDDISNYDNSQAVTPVVGYLSKLDMEQLKCDAREVSSVFTVPLADLQDEGNWITKEVEWRGLSTTQFYYDVEKYRNSGDGDQLWGLSAYATLGLLSALEFDSTTFQRKIRTIHEQYKKHIERRLGTEA